MILTCNSCGKKFVVPDNAITDSGRTVQCGSCGNKWKQFPIKKIQKTESISRAKKILSQPSPTLPKTQRSKKFKKVIKRKPREINLYSPEYLAKKHGIKLNNNDVGKTSSKSIDKVSLGFYNSLLLLLVSIISIEYP